jgi:sortase (surface protein transpeptidase)
LGGARGGFSITRRRALIAAPVVVLIAVGLALLLWPDEPKPAPRAAAVRVEPNAPLPLRVERPEPKRRPKPKPKREPKRDLKIRIDRNAASPIAVTVPSVGISAPVIPLGLQSNGEIEVPSDFSDAGWREAGPEPGERGAAMMTAHVDSRSSGPAAFYSLKNVERGSDIRVRRKDGSTVVFTAERMEVVPKDNFPTSRVYGRTRLPTLRLVTCGGPFNSAERHYRDNIIVYATRKPS